MKSARHILWPAGVLIAVILSVLPSKSVIVIGNHSPEESRKPMLHASGRTLRDSNGEEVLLRCVNLDPWLNRQGYLIRRNIFGLFKSRSEVEGKLARLVGEEEAAIFWREWEERFFTDSDMAIIKRQGFNCVRLPFDYSRVLANPDHTNHKSRRLNPLEPIDRAIAYGSKHKVYIILSLHGAPGGENDLPTVSDVPSYDTKPRLWAGPYASHNQDLVVELWRRVATRYKDAPYLGGYDLINEPRLPRGADSLRLTRMYKRIIAAIRETDPYHLIIIEGSDYARSPSLPGLHEITDNNLMFSFHAYNLFDKRWKEPSQKAFEPYLQTGKTYNLPVWLGEFGEDNHEWIGDMIRIAEQNNVGWALWPWKRVDLGTYMGTERPAIQEIHTPPEWDKLVDFLVGTPFRGAPTKAVARIGMHKMLDAIKTENTVHNRKLLLAIHDAQRPPSEYANWADN